MDRERWRHIEELYNAAVDRSPAERSALLAQADPDTRAEVEAMLAQPSGGAVLDQCAAKLLNESKPSRLPAGTRLGPYQILASIGAGGMGEVYRARDTQLGRDVAIKALPAIDSWDESRRRRFEEEARAVAALNHPNILAVYQLGNYQGAPYLGEYIFA